MQPTRSPLHGETHLPYLFEAKILPEDRFMPEVGNGHVATVALGPYVHMNGLYDGLGCNSSRARIPSLIGFKTAMKNVPVVESYQLNLKEGIFRENKVLEDGSVTLTREIFAHRLHPHLLVMRLLVEFAPGTESVIVELIDIPPTDLLVSPDIEFVRTKEFPYTETTGSALLRHYSVSQGFTRTPEVAESPKSPVTVAWYSNWPLEREITVTGNNLDLVLYLSVGSEGKETVASLLDAMDIDFPSLRASHVAKWSEYWESGRIEVDPAENFALAQALYSTFYFLLSSLPNADCGHGFIGLSPGGLARGAPGAEIDQDYLGHSFWDTEMWMFPPILFFHPDQARILIEARIRILDQALKNADAFGKEGAKFPWEAGMTGVETTPWPPAADYQHHVTADIAFAVRQFLYASNNKKQLIQDMGLDRLVEEIAAWWQSLTVMSDNDTTCSINSVMGPDEYHYPVNNSAFTNYAAKLALQLPSYVLDLIGKHDARISRWNATAAKIPIPTGTTPDGRAYHPEFDGFTVDPDRVCRNRTVKQADVILLGYPLEMEMSREMKETDLDTYREITVLTGPAMTWSMFAVGYLELGRRKDADVLFAKYTEHSQAPFGVWSEYAGGDGAVNFLTGMGGFLQSVINGYGGFRLRSDHLAFNPMALPGTTRWSVTGAKYLGCHLNFAFDFTTDTIAVTLGAVPDFPVDLIVETLSGGRHLLHLNHTVTYQREPSSILQLSKTT
ncbi:Acid trehalase-like protein 1 [Hypsibius exemplaris]|uniref:Protein-glucosylgalactosylhydroxylysine glucosidase n=1 Tax=Hypsibius exemplaris TaxID=2072580 RepID=A0A1W0XDE6_HYPEX|nr:Acid trehalase-like protein 1 [Hypsibius exemplaris]